LLNESVEHGRNAKLALASTVLWNRNTLHCARLIAAREEVLAMTRPVLAQIHGKLFHRHPIDARTPFVTSNSLHRGLHVLALTHEFHQAAARSWARVSISRQRRFRAALYIQGFTPALER
jgi:hypothetical protein